jgi:hypothetical protein
VNTFGAIDGRGFLIGCGLASYHPMKVVGDAGDIFNGLLRKSGQVNPQPQFVSRTAPCVHRVLTCGLERRHTDVQGGLAGSHSWTGPGLGG